MEHAAPNDFGAVGFGVDCAEVLTGSVSGLAGPETGAGGGVGLAGPVSGAAEVRCGGAGAGEAGTVTVASICELMALPARLTF